MIGFGREICRDFSCASQREWLVANGIGGFASGTVAGALTRRYHGLLIAALRPPLGRTLLVTKLEESATYAGQTYALSSDLWANGAVQPQGYQYLEHFYLDGSIPVWIYAIGDALLEKRIWMQPGENTTYIRYRCLRASAASVHLALRLLVNARDYHGITHANQAPEISIDDYPGGVHFHSPAAPAGWSVRSLSTIVQACHSWQPNYYLSVEAKRGESALEDHLAAAIFTGELQVYQNLTLVASTEPEANLDGETALAARQVYERKVLATAAPLIHTDSPDRAALEHLIQAADQFIVKRPTPLDPHGKTILAGYPWFSDWGRDTMIALPGLTLVTGREEIARSILRTFANYIDRGMLPNRFPDQGETPEYNTVDAGLWFFEALRAYLEKTHDLELIEEIFPALAEMVDWHQRGTRYRIRCDPGDGLLMAGEEGVQLTWMDVKIGDWVVTPRSGKPVEINALWYNALRSMADFARLLGKSAEPYEQAADRARQGFQRFWNPQMNCLFDVLDGAQGNDASLRPNQLIAVSIHHSPVALGQQKAILDCCARVLLTSFGLRSLAPKEAGYISHYGGDRWQRDAAYHQGTVWSWLIGPFVSAHLKVYRDPDLAWSFLKPLFDHLAEAGLGSISEIFDAEPPFAPAGCIAQAWSVGEALRAAYEIQAIKEQGSERL